MRTYTGTQDVEPGIYVNFKRLRAESIEEPGRLPGTDVDHYVRVPMVAMLALAPLFGLAYVIFLPFIGFAMVAWLAGSKVAQLGSTAAAASVRVLRPGWAPALAFLSRSKPSRKPADETETTPDAWTEEVEKKLNDGDDDQG